MIDKKTDAAITGKNILILDQSSGANIAKGILAEAGFNSVKIATNTIQAMELLQKQPFDVVASELYLGNTNAFVLYDRIRDNNEFDKIGFIMFATNASKGLAAQAVEREIDAIISKPFTAKAVTDVFTEVIKKRFSPSRYAATLEKAKAEIEAGKYEQAFNILGDALTLDAKPALANYYLAEIMIRKGNIDTSEDYFKKGLSFKPNNLKCLFGLAFCMEKKKQQEEAYKISKRIINLYPTSQKRMKFLIDYAMEKKLQDDLFFFIGVATNIEFMSDDFKKDLAWKSTELARSFMLNKADVTKANTLIITARKLAFSDLPLRRELADILIDSGSPDFAEKEISYCKQNKDTSDDLLYVDAKAAFALKQYMPAIKLCQELINKRYYKPEVYLLVARAYNALSDLDRAVKFAAIALKEMPDSFAAKQLLEDTTHKKEERDKDKPKDKDKDKEKNAEKPEKTDKPDKKPGK